MQKVWAQSLVRELGSHMPQGAATKKKKTQSFSLSLLLFLSAAQSLSHVQLFTTPRNAACQASLSFTMSRSLLKLMSIESATPSNHVILCHPLLLLPSIFPSIRVFSNESVLCIKWPKYWNFSFSISPSSEYSGMISFRILTGWISLQSKGLSRVFSNTTLIYLVMYLWLQSMYLCCRPWGRQESDTTERLNNNLWLHLGLRCSELAFSSCDKWGLLFVTEHGLLIEVTVLVAACGLSCSPACGIFPDQGLNPCPLCWQADS